MKHCFDELVLYVLGGWAGLLVVALSHCKGVVRYVFSLFGVQWVILGRAVNLLACWEGCSGRHWNSEIWNATRDCMMYCIWMERNARNFEGCERKNLYLKLHFLRTLFKWVSASGSFSFSNVLEFIDNPTFKA